MVYAKTRIRYGELDVKGSQGFSDTNRSPNLDQKTRPCDRQQQKKENPPKSRLCRPGRLWHYELDICTYMYTHVCVCTHTCVRVCVYIYTHVHVCAHAHTYTDTHTHIYTHIYVTRWVRFGLGIKFQILGKPINQIKKILIRKCLYIWPRTWVGGKYSSGTGQKLKRVWI